MKAIRIFLTFVEYKNFKVYQVYVKSAFLNGELEEKIYIEQPDGFQMSKALDIVCKLKTALYGLKQASIAWYARLDRYLLQLNFKKGTTDSNFYFKAENGKLLILIVYVDDIIFGGDEDVCKKIAKEMQKEFEMTMIGELSFFFGIQVTQSKDGILISQTKYIKEMLKKFDIENCKPIGNPMVTGFYLSKDDESLEVD